ncbi:lytic transglycosylase domain-containing protein [Rodentibacter pneumotropicus]|uniref:Lytic transglycosylase domain-containing protein n=1 Tax=Rodentibacter pneumotropicus TaxID=758 RepID=A0A4S2Q3T1_9PAST|nr:lytic transglycosylase domain-containing protein [Rodentibacter pneumotropicus]THA00575.1 lytic transglycosylase domain-containing protein [Rodentibacter pneumotropicus]THA11243.1 lytic transglycosylase domain-containing protein [Rodentibacter pneumotropicus]
MSMTTLQLIAMCAPLIHPDTALSVMKEESKLNQFAIGVVDGWVKQPTDFNSAVLTAQQLDKEGKNYSVGLMQINKHNFAKYGVTLEQMFEPCNNLQVAQQILQDCYQRSGSVNDALSCYYSGNFLRGYKKDFRGTSYVERVHAQLNEPTPEKNFTIPSLKNEPLSVAAVAEVAKVTTTKKEKKRQIRKNTRQVKLYKNLPPTEDKKLASTN